MASLGSLALLAAFVIASGAFAACVAGARRGRRALIDGGVGLFHVVTALMLLASAVIVHAFVVGDYRIKYVQHYSDESQPLFYKLTSYWGGLDGSIMFWVTLLAIFGSVAVQMNRERQRLLIPWVVAVISVVEMFFLFLMVVHNNPFDTFLGAAPATGQGLNPLLQNFYMAIHPPMLYLGFVGMTIPFAFGMAALATGQLDDSWFRAVRGWTMMAWLFLKAQGAPSSVSRVAVDNWFAPPAVQRSCSQKRATLLKCVCPPVKSVWSARSATRPLARSAISIMAT